MKTITLLCITLASFAFADDNSFELHRIKAQKLIEKKDWSSAEGEAKAMTEADAKSLEGWLMYGVVEQRLEKNEEASKAYRRYLELNPPAEKATAVRQRLAEVELRSEKVEKETSKQNQERYGSRSDGAYIAFAPLYHPSTSSVMSGDVSNNFQFGVQLQHLNIGLMYDSGTIPAFLAAPSGASGAAAIYRTLGPASLKTYTLYLEYNIMLTEPFVSTGPFAIFIPIHGGVFTNKLALTDGTRNFSNLGAEAAAGLGVQWYNRSPLSLGLTALYHWGVGITDLEEDSNSQGIQNVAGQPVHGGNVGFEIRFTLTFLFGYEKSLAEKAGAQ